MGGTKTVSAFRGKTLRPRKKPKPRIPKATVSHWTLGVKEDHLGSFGFIYLITNTVNGRKYIGKKQYWAAKQKVKGCKSKTMDIENPKWKPCCWNESNWKTYMGSSKSLTADIKLYGKDKFTFEILKNCRSKGVLTYAEIEEHIMRGVMWKLMDDNEYEYYNMQVAACRFRPKEYHRYTSLVC